MKFLFRFTDLLEKANDILFLKYLEDLKSDTNKIYIVIDNADYSEVKDIKTIKKLISKYEKILKKIGIPFHNIFLQKDENLNDTMDRNHFDVLVSSRIQDSINTKENKYVTHYDINKTDLFVEITKFIASENEPLLPMDTKITDKPSKDEIWKKYYTKKEAKDLERFSKNQTSNWQHICDQTSDFDYLTAIDYYGTKISYFELKDNVKKYAQAFAKQGIGYDDKVTICTPNVQAGIYAFYALQELGAIPAMLHVYTPAEDMHEYFKSENTKQIVMIGMQETADNVEKAIEGTNVEKVISVPLSDGFKLNNFESIKMRLGIALITSTFGKKALAASSAVKKYKLAKKAEKTSTKGLLAAVKESVKEAHAYVMPDNEKFTMLEDFLEEGIGTKYVSKVNEICTIIHTGGTTARGKSTLITQKNMNSNDDAFEATIPDFEKGDKIIAIPPIFHILGLNNCVNLILRNGGEIVLISKYCKSALPSLFKKHNPELVFGVPKIARDIITNPNFDENSFKNGKYFVFGGEEMTLKFIDETSDFLKKHGAKEDISQSLGASEGTCCFTNTFAKANVHGSVGIPLINVGVKIVKKVNGEYEEANYGEIGELCFTGDSIMKGYLNNPDATKEALKVHSDGKLWLHTGDSGYINEDGVLFFVDRIKEMVKINGEQVFPSVIKNVILRHPEVNSCAVVCVETVDHKKMLVATITLKNEEVDKEKIKEEINKLCLENLQKESRPRMIEIRTSLPETRLFKLDNQALKKEYEGMNLRLEKSI